MDILTTADYPSVRALIDVSLTATALPDTTIEMAPFAPAAEDELKQRDPDWAAHLADTTVAGRLVRAAIYLTAARLLPALPTLKSESTPDGQSYHRATVEVEDRVAELRDLAAGEIAVLVAADDATTTFAPTFFTAACGKRGR